MFQSLNSKRSAGVLDQAKLPIVCMATPVVRAIDDLSKVYKTVKSKFQK